MGQDVDRTTFSRHDRQRYRANVQRCLDALALMLREHPFATDEPMTGLEVELNLVGDDLEPALRGVAVLDSLGSAEFQTELGRWNLELNLPPLAVRHLVEEAISPQDRYHVLNEQVLTSRGEPIRLDITGGELLGAAPEHLVADFDSIAPEAA